MEIKLAALGMSLRKSLLLGLRSFCIFEKSEKNEATDLASAVRGSTIAISAHVLALTCGRVHCGRPGPEFKFSKTVQVRWSC